MSFLDIAKKAASMSGIAGAVAVDIANKFSTKENFQEGSNSTESTSQITNPLNIIIFVALACIAVYLHYNCHNKNIGVGIIPAIFCPSCYILIFFLTKSCCPSEILKLVGLQTNI